MGAGVVRVGFCLAQGTEPESAVRKACLWGAAALAGFAVVVASLPAARSWAGNPPHGPLGTAKGIFPGRVVWVHAPQATSWAGYTSAEHWFDTNHTDMSVVEQMMSQAVQSVGGGGSDAAAWAAIFSYFNRNHGKGDRGYQRRREGRHQNQPHHLQCALRHGHR